MYGQGKYYLAILIFSLLSFIIQAKPFPPNVPLNVMQVLTGGYWQYNGKDGHYRIIITEQGWEHLLNKTTIEWIQRPESPNEDYQIVAAITPKFSSSMQISVFRAELQTIATNHIKIKLQGNTSFCGIKPSTSMLEITEFNQVTILSEQPKDICH